MSYIRTFLWFNRALSWPAFLIIPSPLTAEDEIIITNKINFIRRKRRYDPICIRE